MKLFRRALPLVCCVIAVRAYATGPGDEVVIVYNTKVPESKQVAEYYAQKRGVPSGQIFGFALAEKEDMSRYEFRDSLQKPLAKALESKKLWHVASHIISATSNQPGRVEWKVTESKIRYLVLCYGVPLRVAHDPAHKDEGVPPNRPELQRNGAAVESELSLLPLMAQGYPLGGPYRNPMAGATNAAQLHPTNGVLLVTRLDGPSAAIARPDK